MLSGQRGSGRRTLSEKVGAAVRWVVAAIAVLLSFLPLAAPRADDDAEPAALPRMIRGVGENRQLLYLIDGATLVVHSRSKQNSNPDGTSQELVELRLDEGQWKRVVFGSRDDLEICLKRLERLLDLRVVQLADVFDLNPTQEEKVWLAGRGDLRRLRQHLEETRMMVDEPLMVESEDSNEARRWIETILKDTMRLRTDLQGDPFLEGSMLAKVLRRQLTAQQIAEYEQRELKLSYVPLGIQRKPAGRRIRRVVF